MPDPREEMADVINLAKMINMDANETNSKIDPSSQNLRVRAIDPRMIVADMVKQVGMPQNNAPTPIANVQTLDGITVSAPKPLIPLPEGYNMPVVTSPHYAPSITTPQQSPATAKSPIEQLELKLEVGDGRLNLVDEFRDIKHLLSVINNKVTELVEFERTKYERRNKRKKVGNGLEGSGEVLPLETQPS